MIDESDLGRDQTIALAVARLIATARSGGDVEILKKPEEEDRSRPAVELVTEDAVGTLAIEHTLVEPFSAQIRDQQQMRPYAEALPGLLEGRLPAGSQFELNLAVGSTNGIKPSPEALKTIAEWAVKTAPQLEVGRSRVDGHMATGRPPELPFPITLVRWPRSTDDPLPQVTIGWWQPDDLPQRRQERLAVALQKKLPKLTSAVAKGPQGVLVLESDDVQLSNAVDIGNSLRAAASDLVQPLPAWIVLWQQYGDTAFVSFLRAASTWIDEPQPSRLPAIP